jgi:hypothetical protein
MPVTLEDLQDQIAALSNQLHTVVAATNTNTNDALAGAVKSIHTNTNDALAGAVKSIHTNTNSSNFEHNKQNPMLGSSPSKDKP